MYKEAFKYSKTPDTLGTLGTLNSVHLMVN